MTFYSIENCKILFTVNSFSVIMMAIYLDFSINVEKEKEEWKMINESLCNYFMNPGKHSTSDIADLINKLLETENSGYAVYDKDLNFLYVSKQYLEIHGVYSSPNSFIGMPMSQFLSDYMWNADQKSIEEDGSYLVARVKRDRKSLTTLNQLWNGSKYLSTGIPIFDDHDNLLSIITIVNNLVNINQYFNENAQFLKNIKVDHLINPFLPSVMPQAEKMNALEQKIRSISSTDITVLITGESGTGKTVTANYLHTLSPRKNMPFIHINCSAVPETLMESEMFGYVAGSFSGASAVGKKGLIEAAEGGTIFLDEIGEMPLAMQTKLLVFLQDGYFYKIGSTKRTYSDVRVIAATNTDLRLKIKSGQLRSDLFYRLNVMPIEIPPLRDRKNEILSFAHTFLQRYNQKYNKNRYFAFNSQYPLLTYKWPGNIRELQHHIERLVLMVEDDAITDETIANDIWTNCVQDASESGLPTDKQTLSSSLREMVSNYERDLLLTYTDIYPSVRQIAKTLGVSHTSVANKLKKYGIQPPKRG
jgi:TyrR family helix-turn-helix protein